MTAVVAARTDRGVVVAADSQAVGSRRYVGIGKIWATSDLIVGAAGNLRAAQVVQHHVSWPKRRAEEEPDYETWLVKSLVPEIRFGTRDHGIVANDKGVEHIDAQLVIASRDQVAILVGNGCVCIEPSGRTAIGSGDTEALGFLGDTGPWTEADVIEAVRRAAITARGVGGPIMAANTVDLSVRTVSP